METPVFAILFGVVIIIAVGLAFAQDSYTTYTTTPTVTNESVVMTLQTTGTGYNGTINLAHQPIVTNSEKIQNVTSTKTTDMVRDTNYKVTDTKGGIISFITNYSSSGKYVNVTYQYYPTGYLSQPMTQQIAALITVLLAVVGIVMITKPMQE
jgi:hypothetical protein